MSNTPDDGGPYALPTDKATEVRFAQPIDLHRFEAARHFAAAWLPIMAADARTHGHGYEGMVNAANGWGLLMADDLLRRLREGQT